MELFFPFVLLGLAVGLLIWGVSNLSVQERYTKLFATIATAVGVAVLGWFFTTYGKGGPQFAVFSGLLLVGLLVWGLINPVVGRRLARIFAVIAMGLGMGLLLWGLRLAENNLSVCGYFSAVFSSQHLSLSGQYF